ncbi:double-strand break repair protein MRE11 [Capronia coronata CBS 617.96]|uniref:Double-strand break repair protein n=1 Tax=Capronia coronata CBS 617.96 TaxID=1182541 RepID=W9ZIT6_9EURO|nr:double-strand break repair protein MRE11 [Capronia coronata CBS 617.96]EXJ94389.1 double-strand break repair protein MRE11 [Capronia coronata CBS 617.96]
MADTISILVATDNHVGAYERDPIRGDDSWRTFHEIMCLAKERDVDMVLLAGDLFHENKPSRKSMYNVMRSLRLNCLGDKPCELEMLSDESEHFDATFDHVNYEDPNINVGIPVFSIHGNHDDPTGDGHYAALDLLAVSGLINYYGKTPQSDNIEVKPVLIQKGRTKLALYGLSNVRDERLYRTFRNEKVKFLRPSQQMGDWYNVICVHQNHHAYTETSYLPENFLPPFLDLVIWGHEHECLIEPRWNPEMNFQVMQPGSSVATSLIPGEAVPKHVAIVTIKGREMKSEPIRLRTVRPYVYKDLVLSTDKEAVRIAKNKEEHRPELTRYLISIVDGLIEQAKAEWQEAQEERQAVDEEPAECPLPLIRLRVETTPVDGVAKFDVENPQRFSNRFIDKVANTTDVVQFHVKKRNAAARAARDAEADREVMAKFQGLENIKVEKLVREFLQAQSLTILPQNYFGDAVAQYVEKDDKHAMEMFVNESLADQIKNLVKMQADANDDQEDEDLAAQINEQRARMEEMFAKGMLKASANKARFKPRPDDWDSDQGGHWEEQPAALLRSSEDLEENEEDEEEEEDATPAPRTVAPTRGRGQGRGRGGRAGAATASTRNTTTTTSNKKPAASSGRGRKRTVPDEDEEDEDEDIAMLDDDEDEEENSQALFFPDKRKPTSTRGRTTTTTPASSGTRGRKAASPAIKKPSARAATTRAKQSTLNFTMSQNSILGNGQGARSRSQSHDIEDDDDDDDEDAFESAPATRRRR